MTRRLDKVKTDKVRGPNSKLITNGPEVQNENKHSSPDKIGRLQHRRWILTFAIAFHKNLEVYFLKSLGSIQKNFK